MVNHRLKIDVRQQIIEVEGEEQFVREMYEEFKRLSTEKASAGSIATRQRVAERKQEDRYRAIEGLSLVFEGDQKLQEFFSQKRPKTAFEKNTAFVYYLRRLLGIEKVTANHIYTCYKYLELPLPVAFRQSLVDTSYKKQYIDTKNMVDIQLTLKGENFVEFELPRV